MQCSVVLACVSTARHSMIIHEASRALTQVERERLVVSNKQDGPALGDGTQPELAPPARARGNEDRAGQPASQCGRALAVPASTTASGGQASKRLRAALAGWPTKKVAHAALPAWPTGLAARPIRTHTLGATPVRSF